MPDLCAQLHTLMRSGKRFDFGMGYKSIPDNGIYIMFEKGETAHEGDRIVLIGTNTGDKQLGNRIHQHFEENKNRSIFRKNIGRCILNRNENPYLATWELDTTARANKELYADRINSELEAEIEKQISSYIQSNFSFCLFNIPAKEDRLYFKVRMIGTVSSCNKCHPSAEWLGLHSPVEEIRDSGLWQVRGLYKTPLSEEDLVLVSELLVQNPVGG
ncbi:MAG: hypothetical protein LBU30_05660 [Candidatus Methanoplasma sp.]|jgi:hypothetical protein|nr:hypothetical protein [Candidatus Methanoplasma sp.]